MTRPRNDNHSTEFGLWLREQKRIDSCLGFVATNLDYIWSNYKTGEWVLIEEKRYNKGMTFSQRKQFEILHNAAKIDLNYKGFYLIVFENTSPNDGYVKINDCMITNEELINFLTFEIEIESLFGGVLVGSI